MIERATEILEENGGLFPPGTSDSMAYVIGPDGTVYRRGTEGVDRASLGLMGTLNEIRNQHIAATGKKHADAGDTGALINHALDQGAIDPVSGTLAIGAFAGALGGNAGITFSPVDRSGGGSGGRKARDHGKNERHGVPTTLERAQPKLDEYQRKLDAAESKTEKQKIRQKMKNTRKKAEEKKKGTEHSRGKKR